MPQTPDEFCEAVQFYVEMELRDHPKAGAAITFKEGKELATKIALRAADIYRRQIGAQD